MAATLSVTDLAKKMFEAMKPVLQAHWKDVSDYAKTEAKKTAETLALIAKKYADKTISKDTAKAYLQMQKGSTQNVLLTIKGIGIIAAQQAINAALKAVKAPVNAGFGFTFL